MALRLIPCSPRRRLRLVTVAAGLMADRSGWIESPPTAWHQQRVSGPHGFAVRNQRRSSAQRRSLTRRSPPCDHRLRRRCRVHRIPSRVRDDARPPLCGWDRSPILLIWVWRQVYFGKTEMTADVRSPSGRRVSFRRARAVIPEPHEPRRARRWSSAPHRPAAPSRPCAAACPASRRSRRAPPSPRGGARVRLVHRELDRALRDVDLDPCRRPRPGRSCRLPPLPARHGRSTGRRCRRRSGRR